MCSLRIQEAVKNELTAIALKEGRSLSALIEKILREFLDHREEVLFSREIQQEKRIHLRKTTLLPARWRIKLGEQLVEYDVIVKNISAGGVYTEYINGHDFQIVRKLPFSPLALVVRMPGESESTELECKVQRVHVTEESVGVGLRFTEALDENDLK